MRISQLIAGIHGAFTRAGARGDVALHQSVTDEQTRHLTCLMSADVDRRWRHEAAGVLQWPLQDFLKRGRIMESWAELLAGSRVRAPGGNLRAPPPEKRRSGVELSKAEQFCLSNNQYYLQTLQLCAYFLKFHVPKAATDIFTTDFRYEHRGFKGCLLTLFPGVNLPCDLV